MSLEIAGQLTAIGTFLIATGGYFYYRWEFRNKRIRLEKYLKEARNKASDDERGMEGQHTFFHLMKEVSLTEAEILQASFKSNHIERFNIVDKNSKRAIGLLFGYQD